MLLRPWRFSGRLKAILSQNSLILNNIHGIERWWILLGQDIERGVDAAEGGETTCAAIGGASDLLGSLEVKLWPIILGSITSKCIVHQTHCLKQHFPDFKMWYTLANMLLWRLERALREPQLYLSFKHDTCLVFPQENGAGFNYFCRSTNTSRVMNQLRQQYVRITRDQACSL